ncbi:mitochondrial carrier domain-containing protein [Scenedesmus sp. NREL 46B-D3]|nr:mitochondrial carrier domain-containing protein [Scenedesmus sp. NREL 46B-D3]
MPKPGSTNVDSTSSSGKQQEKQWSHMVAGGVAGCSAVLLLHPFDVVKTRLQVQDGLPGALPAYRGTVDAVRTIVAREGWLGLYAGLTPSMLGSTVSWGAYLYLYERLKAWHRGRQGQAQGSKLSTTWNLLSAAQAGAMVCGLTNPIWLVKTRLALQQRGQLAAAGGGYSGIADAFVRIGRSEGLAGYYKGFGPSLVLQTAHGAIQFAAYEELKHLAARAGSGGAVAPDRQLTSAEVSAYGAASKFLAAVSTYPTQVIRSRLQQRAEGRHLVYTSSWQAITLTWQREGLAGFYKGLAPSLMRVMPQSAITLMVYEGLVKVLDEQFGGSSSSSSRLGDNADQQEQQQQQQQRWPEKRQHRQQQQQQQYDVDGEQQSRPYFQWQRPWLLLTDKMTPLIIADSQAEQ